MPRSCRRASTRAVGGLGRDHGCGRPGPSATCPAGVTMGALDVAGLSWTSWDMIQNVRRADQAHSRSYGRHTDRTPLSRGEEWRIRRSAGIPMGRDGLPVKPSATPSQVRILDLPPLPGTAPGPARMRPCSCFVRSPRVHGGTRRAGQTTMGWWTWMPSSGTDALGRDQQGWCGRGSCSRPSRSTWAWESKSNGFERMPTGVARWPGSRPWRRQAAVASVTRLGPPIASYFE